MPTTIGTGFEQLPLTVNRLLQEPLVVPELMRNLFMGQFVADQILRPAGHVTGGAIQYWVSGPVYPDVTGGDAEVVAPLSEIPVVNPIVGTPASELVYKRGLGLRISRELAERNNIGAVQRGLQQIRNGIVRSVDGVFFTKLTAAITQTVAAGAPWATTSGTTIRKDIMSARLIISNLKTSGYEYQPDTLLMSDVSYNNLVLSPEFLAPFVGAAAQQSPALTGNLGGDGAGAPTNGVYKGNVWGYNILSSPLLPSTKVYLLQSNVLGGIGDERGSPGQPIEVSDMYPEPSHEAQRWNVTRAAAGFIDNPFSAVAITST